MKARPKEARMYAVLYRLVAVREPAIFFKFTETGRRLKQRLNQAQLGYARLAQKASRPKSKNWANRQ